MKETKVKYAYTTKTAVRTAFWEDHSEFRSEFRTRKRQNDYNVDIRSSFVEWTDYMQRNGFISEKMCKDITL